MISKISRGIKPIVVVSQDTMREAFAIVRLADEKKEAKASIRFRNDDTIHTNIVDNIFTIPDKKSNPITQIDISSGSYGTKYIEIKFGGSWSSSTGAELKVHGDPVFTNEVSEKFAHAFDRERPISESIPSMDSFLLGLCIAIVVVAFFGWGRLPDLIDNASNGDMIVYFLAITLIAPMALSMPINALQNYVFGRAAFLWGDGETRFNKNVKVANYFLWVIPIALLLKLV